MPSPSIQTHSVCAELSDGDIHSLQEKLAKLSEHFTIEEDQDSKFVSATWVVVINFTVEPLYKGHHW